MKAPAATQPNGPLLRDIHLPPQPSWWPPAPGLWMLTLLVMVASGIALWWWRGRRRRREDERRVLAEVDAALALWREQPQALAAGLHQLLRRGAARLDPLATRQRGEDWRSTLARMPVDAATLAQLERIEPAIYRRDGALDADAAELAALVALAAAWATCEVMPVST